MRFQQVLLGDTVFRMLVILWVAIFMLGPIAALFAGLQAILIDTFTGL